MILLTGHYHDWYLQVQRHIFFIIVHMRHVMMEGLETITGDDTLIVGIKMQYCDDCGSCTDASVVAVDREVYK